MRGTLDKTIFAQNRPKTGTKRKLHRFSVSGWLAMNGGEYFQNVRRIPEQIHVQYRVLLQIFLFLYGRELSATVLITLPDNFTHFD